MTLVAGFLSSQLSPIETTGCLGIASAPTRPFAAGDYIQLTRTSCAGACPAYRVRVYGDGRVYWSGQSYVQVVGLATGNVGPAAVRNLVGKFRAAGYWGLCDSYNRHVAGVPVVVTMIHYAGVEKSVSDRGDGAPEWFHELEREMDSLASGGSGRPSQVGSARRLRSSRARRLRSSGASRYLSKLWVTLRPATALPLTRDTRTRTI